MEFGFLLLWFAWIHLQVLETDANRPSSAAVVPRPCQMSRWADLRPGSVASRVYQHLSALRMMVEPCLSLQSGRAARPGDTGEGGGGAPPGRRVLLRSVGDLLFPLSHSSAPEQQMRLPRPVVKCKELDKLLGKLNHHIPGCS